MIKINVGAKVKLKDGTDTAKVFCYLHEELPPSSIVVMLDRPLNGTEFWHVEDLEVIN